MTGALVVIILLAILLIASSAESLHTENELRAQVRGRDGRIRQLETELQDMSARHVRDLARLRGNRSLLDFLALGTRTTDPFDLRGRMN